MFCISVERNKKLAFTAFQSSFHGIKSSMPFAFFFLADRPSGVYSLVRAAAVDDNDDLDSLDVLILDALESRNALTYFLLTAPTAAPQPLASLVPTVAVASQSTLRHPFPSQKNNSLLCHPRAWERRYFCWTFETSTMLWPNISHFAQSR